MPNLTSPATSELPACAGVLSKSAAMPIAAAVAILWALGMAIPPGPAPNAIINQLRLKTPLRSASSAPMLLRQRSVRRASWDVLCSSPNKKPDGMDNTSTSVHLTQPASAPLKRS